MDPEDRLQYELALIALQDAREECLRSLEDEPPVLGRRRAGHWWSLGHWMTHPEHPLAS